MKPAVKPTATEQHEQQVLRAIAMKREAFFQLILGNLLQNPNVVHETIVTVSGKDGKEHRQINIIDVVDSALDGADRAIQLLYPIKYTQKATNDGNE